MMPTTMIRPGGQKALVRAVIRLAAEHLLDAPPTDYGPDNTLHAAVAGIVMDLIARLDEPRIRERLAELLAEEEVGS
jgi:hypothetical protein